MYIDIDMLVVVGAAASVVRSSPEGARNAAARCGNSCHGALGVSSSSNWLPKGA